MAVSSPNPRPAGRRSRARLARRNRLFIQALEPRLLLVATPYTSDGLPWPVASDHVSWVEAENFDTGGEGVAYHDTSTANQGGAYRPNEGVDLEGPQTSCDNTYNIGYSANGEWTQYTINVAAAGDYQINLRTAGAAAVGTTAGTAHVTFGGVNLTGTLTIPGTGGWQAYQNVTSTVTLPAGTQAMRLYVDSAGFNTDFISLTPVASLSNPEQPYGTMRGLPPMVPAWGSATVEAENYDLGGQDVAYHKGNIAQNTHGNYTQGTPPVTYTFRATDYVSTTYLPYSNSDLSVIKWDGGDWTQYSVAAQTAGTYELLLNYINTSATTATMSIQVNGATQVSSLALPNTGGGNMAGDYRQVAGGITLNAGMNLVRLTAISAPNVNVDSFLIRRSTSYGNSGVSYYLPPTGTTQIEAENFDVGPTGAYYTPGTPNDGPAAYRAGTGIYTEATTDTGAGYDVSSIVANEHFDYTIRPDLIGRYDLLVRVAAPATGGSFHVLFNGVDRTGTVTVPTTGGAQSWVTLNLSVVFTNDLQTMRFEALSGGFSVNWFQLTKDTTTPVVLGTATPGGTTQVGSYAQEPPDAALNSTSDLFSRVFDKQYDWINKPADAPVPTNDWWTNILENTFAGALWSYPAKLNTSANGVDISAFNSLNVTEGNVGFGSAATVTVNPFNGAFTRDALVDYSDWLVRFRMEQTGAGYVDITMVQGDPFTWMEYSGLDATHHPTLSFSTGYTLRNSSGTALTGTFTADNFRVDTGAESFAVYAPTGTTFTLSGGTLTATSNPAYLVVAILPENTSAALTAFRPYAYAIPRATTYNWTYSAPQALVSTTWDLTTALLAGAPAGSSATDTIQGWMPHNYLNVKSGSSTLSLWGSYQYVNINGPIKLTTGHSWTINQISNNLAFELPAPAVMGGAADYNSAQMSYYLQKFAAENASVPVYGNDTYWGGKDLQLYAEYALMATQLGDATAAKFISALKTAMTDWFTYTPGETAHYFAYYQKDKALIGFNGAYTSENYTDNHFHYGYFTSSAGVLGMFDPTWASQYGALATMVAKEYANWDRTDTRFPFLRTFNPWLGHSFAGGTGDARGNNQESISEGMQSWQGLVLLGTALGDQSMIGAGMMGFTEEAKAEQYYWFGTPDNPLPTGFNRSNVAIKYTDAKGAYTWFSGAPECIFGIVNLPLWPSMEFDGQYAAGAATATSLLLTQVFTQDTALTNIYGAYNPANVSWANWEAADAGNQWIAIALGYVQQYDPQTAAVEFARGWTNNYGFVTDKTAGIYYGQIQSHRTHGTRDWNYHLSLPLGGVYTNSSLTAGSHTYIVYNPAATAQTVNVYDANNNIVDSFTAKAHDTTTVVRGQVISSMLLTGSSAAFTGTSQQYTATIIDQARNALASQPTITWSLGTGSVGTLSSTGLYTAPASGSGTATITATGGSLSQTMAVTVASLPAYPTGFPQSDTSMSLNGGATITTGQRLHLTDAATQTRSAFYNVKLDVTHFVTSFNFQITQGTTGGNWAEGMAFVLQNNAATSVGSASSGLGYQNLGSSVGIKFDLWDNSGEGTNSTGLYTNGAAPTLANSLTMPTSGIDLRSGHVINAVVAYDGTNLMMTLTDTTDPSRTYTHTWQVDIPTTVGGSSAYAGFTGATGGYAATQEITSWTWNQPVVQVGPVPAAIAGGVSQAFTATYVDNTGVAVTNPAGVVWSLDSGSPGTINSAGVYTAPFNTSGSAVVRATVGAATSAVTVPIALDPNFYSTVTNTNLTLNNGATVTNNKLRVLDGTGNKARSVYNSSKVNVSNFVTNFTFQVPDATTNSGDGFTFVLQNSSATAVGGGGGSLGYQGIGNSIAVKFDYYGANGENNSTGLYVNGAAPTSAGMVVMPTTGANAIDLHTTHTFNVTLAYAGTTLTMTITDTSTSKSFTTSWTVDIPGTIGSASAWAGFTGATGGSTMTLDISKWTWNKPQAYITPVSPDPRQSSVASLPVSFNRPITGLDLSDITMTRNGVSVALTGASLNSPSDQMNYTLSGLGSLTATPGVYQLTVSSSSGANIKDSWGNLLGADAAESWTTTGAVVVPSSTSVSSSLNPAAYGQSVTLTATVTGAGGTPVGTVTFKDGSTTLGTALLDGTGHAALTTSALAAGSHSITVVYAGDGLFTSSTSAAFTQTVTQVMPTITWSNPAAIAYGTALSGTQLNATASVPGAFTYTQASGTVLNAGTQTLSVTFTPTDSINYASATGSAQITVNKAHLTETADAKSKTYDGTAYSGFTATLGGFVNGDTSAAVSGNPTFSGSAVGATAAGAYTITPAQGTLFATNYDFTAFSNATLTISKAHLTVTADSKSKAYDGAVYSGFTATLSGFVNGETASVVSGSAVFSGSGMTATAPGSYTVTPAAGTLSASNYDFTTFGNGTLTINQATPAVSLGSSGSPAIFGQPVTLTATVTGTGGTPTGMVTFQDGATVLGTGTLNGAGQATFTISSLTAGAHAITAVYGGDTYFAGTISAVVNQRVNYLAPVTPTITWANPAPITYGTALSTTQLNATATYGGATIAGTYAYNRLAGTVLGAGANQALSVTFTPTDTINYTAATVSVQITVNKAHLTVTADAKTKTYDGSTYTGGFTATISGFVNGDTSSVVSGAPGFSGSALTAVNAGNYPVTPAIGALSASNYDFTSFNAGVLNIAQAPAFVAHINFQATSSAGYAGYVADTGLAYGARNGYTYGWNADNSGGNNPVNRNNAASPDERYDTFIHMQRNGTYTWDIAVPNGTYTVHIAAGDPSYKDSAYKINVEGALAVDGSYNTVQWIEGTVTVPVSDGKLSLTNATGSQNNKIDYIDIASADTTAPSVSAKTPDTGGSVTSSTTNIDVTFSEPVTGMDASDLVLTGAGAAGAVTGAPVPLGGLTWRFPVSGLTSGAVNVSLAPSANTITDLATNSLANATWSFNVVVPTTPTITWTNPAAITYGTALGSTQLNATASVPGTFVYSQPAGTVLGAGANQALNVTFTPTDTVNYTSATASVLLTVNKAHLTVTAGSQSKTYDASAISGFTATLSGFVNGDGSGVVSGSAGFTGNAVGAINAGTYSVTPTAGTLAAANYDFASFSPASVIINQATTAVAVSASPSPGTSGQPETLTATVTLTSGAGTPTGTVTFKDGAAVVGTATLNSAGHAALTTSALAVGSHSITAVYAGDTNFVGSTSAPAALVVNQPITITQQPANQTVNQNSPVTLRVAASGTMPVTYHWAKDGIALADGPNISGATTDTLTIAATGTGDAGAYTCVVSNVAGSLSSSPATLTVNVASVAANTIWFHGTTGADTMSLDAANGILTAAVNGAVMTFPAAGIDSIRVAGVSGADTLALTGGAFTFTTSVQADAPNLSLVVGTGAAATFQGDQSLAALSIAPGGSAALAAGSSAVLVTSGLSLDAAGSLDINDGAVLVRSGAIGVWDPVRSAYTGLTGLLASGAIRSTAASLDATLNHGLAIMTAQQAQDNGNALADGFHGRTVTSSDVLVQYGWNGDMNLDGRVDYLDYGAIDNAYLYNQAHPATPKRGCAAGDLNFDGVISYLDYGMMDNAFLAANAPHAASAAAMAAAPALVVPAATPFATAQLATKPDSVVASVLTDATPVLA